MVWACPFTQPASDALGDVVVKEALAGGWEVWTLFRILFGDFSLEPVLTGNAEAFQ